LLLFSKKKTFARSGGPTEAAATRRVNNKDIAWHDSRAVRAGKLLLRAVRAIDPLPARRASFATF
jgi:hypothetical protein